MEEALSRLQLSVENEFEDEEDDEDVDEKVLLGFVEEELEEPWKLQRQWFPSKAGGTPAWLDPINLPSKTDSCCGICEEPLDFLLQTYAEIDGNEDAFHRIIYVFMCRKMECLRKNENLMRSVKVFRSQLRRNNSFYSSEPAKNRQDQPLSQGGNNYSSSANQSLMFWAAELCSWCSTWKGGSICGGCKKRRYCCRKHQVEDWRNGHASTCNKPQNEAAAAAACHKNLWPEFAVTIAEEPDEEEEEAANSLITNSIHSADTSDLPEPSKEEEWWANFQARIGREGRQVMRYCRGGNPLWPSISGKASPENIPPCQLCGGRRIFEFQILSQLLYMVRVSNDVDSVDWSTIVVYSCESSCCIKSGYAQEYSWVVV